MQQRHVPKRMDHDHATNAERTRCRAVSFSQKIHTCAIAWTENQIADAEPSRKDFRDVAVRHEQTVADHEPRAAVGKRRVLWELDASDRRNGFANIGFYRNVIVEV